MLNLYPEYDKKHFHKDKSKLKIMKTQSNDK